jgi:hypothetical protein
VDFFEDELALKFGYDWKRVADEYLFTGKEPLINGLVGGRKPECNIITEPHAN